MMQGAAKACDKIDINDKEMVEYGNQFKQIPWLLRPKINIVKN